MLKEWKTSVLLFLLLVASFYGLYFTYKQAQLDKLEIAKNKKETNLLIKEIEEYKETTHAEINKQLAEIDKDIKDLKLGLDFSDKTQKRYSKEQLINLNYSQAEQFYAKCIAALNLSDSSNNKKQSMCINMVIDHYPKADLTRIIDHSIIF